MKAVVLAAGAGVRMRPIAYTLPKQLIPVANKPVLFYGLEAIAAAGIKEVAIVVGPDSGDAIAEAVGAGDRFGLTIEYITQPAPQGIAHGLGMARSFVGSNDVLLYLGDSMLERGLGEAVADFTVSRPNAHVLVSRAADPGRFGVVTVDAGNTVARIVEKPRRPDSDLVLVGAYLFDSAVWAALDEIRPSQRGELEISDAIQHLVDSGKRVTVSEVEGWWKDTGDKVGLLDANRLVLSNLHHAVHGMIEGGSSRGPVAVGTGSTLQDCDLIGPVTIGANVTASDCVLGPNTSIADNCSLAGAFIVGSIVLEGCRLERWRLDGSVLGRNVTLTGQGPEAAVSAILGDLSEVVGK